MNCIHKYQVPLYDAHIMTTLTQKDVLAIGSSVMAIYDTYRADMIAVLGEVIGQNSKMKISLQICN